MTAPVAANTEDRNLARAIAWVRAIEEGQTGDALMDYVTPDVVHEDVLNGVFPNDSKSDLRAMRAASERGPTIMRRQRYDILSARGQWKHGRHLLPARLLLLRTVCLIKSWAAPVDPGPPIPQPRGIDLN